MTLISNAETSPIIFGDRIRQAREVRGLTQTELANQIGTSQAIIAQFESGLRRPSPNHLGMISFQTGFPPSFFRQEPLSDFPLGSLLYRARQTTAARQKTEAYQYGKIVYECALKLSSRVTRIPLSLPSINDRSPHDSARLTRSALGLTADTPIPRLVRVLERGGVLALLLPFQLERVDAYSAWAGRDHARPVVIMSQGKPADRLRFSIAHELGHLVMHSPIAGAVAELETEANQFASEFLAPAAALEHEIIRPTTLTTLAGLKPRWGISIQALIERSWSMKLITERQRRYLYEQVSVNGWRRREPDNLHVREDEPKFMLQAAEILYGDPIDYDQLAIDMNLRPSMVREIFEVYKPNRGIVASVEDDSYWATRLPIIEPLEDAIEL